MGREGVTYGANRNACLIVVGKPQGQRPYGRRRRIVLKRYIFFILFIYSMLHYSLQYYML